MKRSVFFLLVLWFSQYTFAAPSAAAPRILRIDGIITATTLQQIEQDLSGWINSDPIPAGLIVLMNSPGGDGQAAMKIGRLLRRENAQIFVTGQCESACVFILASGVVRAANSGTVGVHAGRLTLTNRDGVILKEIDSSQSLTNSFKLTSFNSGAHQYLSEMGIKNGLIDVMLSHQTKQTYKLTDFEMQQFGVIGFDNDYLRKRGDLFASLPVPEKVNRIELYKRTLSIPKLCSNQAANNNAFIECYKTVLFGEMPQ